MKVSLAALPALILALGIYTLGILPAGNRMLASDAARDDAQKQSGLQAAEQSIWTIGIYTGRSPFQLAAPEGLTNPVLTGADVSDLEVNIVAHPFMAVTDSAYYLFFTAKNDLSEEYSGIGMAESRDGLRWQYRQIVLKEPFVLAHPYVFKWRDEYYMIPEAHKETFLRLYRATHFPDRWEYVKDLLTGEHFISATVIRYADMWWMFVIPPGNETLRLFFAPEPTGPWTEHPESPVIEKDLESARPGGRPFIVDGLLYRLGQDCYPTYGNQVFAYQITEISPTVYREKKIETPLVKASAEGWNAEAMHHVDAHQTGPNKWIAAVDALGKPR